MIKELWRHKETDRYVLVDNFSQRSQLDGRGVILFNSIIHTNDNEIDTHTYVMWYDDFVNKYNHVGSFRC